MFRKTFHVSWLVVLVFTALWLILILILLRPRSPIPPDEVVWTRVVNDEYDFSVEYPSKWVAETFGENGSRGATDIKLEIYQTQFGNFRVYIFQRKSPRPYLQDVSRWGETMISEANTRLRGRGEPTYKEINLWEDSLQGQPILRRRYGNERFLFEDVYIARHSDMIIITLQSETAEFESYLDDFNRIVASFEPVE